MIALAKSSGDDATESGTLTERAAGLITADILNNRFDAGAKLGVMELCERYEIGPTPIREALSRLSTSGFVRAVGRRGFQVAPLSRDDLQDIVWLRQSIESEALLRAMRSGDSEWEASIVASLHLLLSAGESHARQRGSVPDLESIHKRFHRHLLAACGSDRLLQMSDALYNQMYRYRCAAMMTPRWSNDFCDEHKKLADLVLRRDGDRAAAFLKQHIKDVFDMLYPD